MPKMMNDALTLEFGSVAMAKQQWLNALRIAKRNAKLQAKLKKD